MINWGSTFKTVYYQMPKSGESIPVTCPICGVHTHAVVVYHDTTPASKHVHLPDSKMHVYNYLLKCTQCSSDILLYWTYTDDHFSDQRSTAGKRMYPFPTTVEKNEYLDENIVPAAICEDLRQAELSYLAASYRGAGLLLRSAFQNVCRDKGAVGKDLYHEIKDLATKGLINAPLAEMVDCVRLLGNEIAHPNPNTPFITTGEDVASCREFINQILDTLYVGPYKAKILKGKLGKK